MRALAFVFRLLAKISIATAYPGVVFCAIFETVANWADDVAKRLSEQESYIDAS